MEHRNSKRALITFGLVHTELQRTNDFLKGIAPIFTIIASDLDGQPFHEDVFQKRLQTLFGLRLPEEILSTFPPKLQKPNPNSSAQRNTTSQRDFCSNLKKLIPKASRRWRTFVTLYL